jgi:protein required for attachment to host cells
MTREPEGWIFIVDREEGRLLHLSVVPGERYHLEVLATLKNDWEEHQRGRPSPRVGRNGNSYASWGHEDEEMLSRFARDVVTWCEQRMEQMEIDRLVICAPPRFLGAFRHARSPQLADRVVEREANLNSMGAGELASHPLIAELAKENPWRAR